MSPSVRDDIEGAALAVTCPSCGARVGVLCKTRSGRFARRHHERRCEAARARRSRSWRRPRR